MSVWGIASLVWGATVWIAAADADRPAGVGVRSRAAAADESPAAINDADVHITAEDVLKALRRRRPSRRIIEPASALGRTVPVKKPLWPEGASLVEQSGWIEQEGPWWVFHAESTDEIPLVKLLANAALEGMVRTAQGASEPVHFQLSGEFTVFRDENYLLPRFATRLRQESPKLEELRPPGSEGSEMGEESNGAPTKIVATDAPIDDVLSVLASKSPTRRLVSMNDRRHTPSAAPGIAVKQSLLPDGSPLVERPGRLSTGADGWIFVFESDRPEFPEPPMQLLLNMNAELMVDTFTQGATGLVFLVSGEVTSFDGRNYLLPRIARRRIDTGNLTK